ncbi:hypothetical protein RYX36_028349 [Vicia faba]
MQKKKPLLVYASGVGLGQKQIFCSISDPTKTYSTSINPILLRASRLCTVQHGWYLLENYITYNLSEFFLWHPYYLNKIILPSLNHTGNTIAYYILSPPLTQNPNDLPRSIFLFPSHSASIIYLHLGYKQWTHVNFYKGIIDALRRSGEPPGQFDAFLLKPVYCNGYLYASVAVPSRTRLAQILIQQPNGHLRMNSTLFPMPTNLLFPLTYQKRIDRTLESNNQIFRIEILLAHDRIIVVFLYRFDSSETMWKKVKSIKDRMFFISSLDSSFACQATNPEIEGGRIYIALDNKDFVYIYNIEDDSLMMSQSFSNLPKDRSYSRWIMPTIGISDTLEDENGKAQQIREKENMCGAIHLKETEENFALPIDIVEVIAKHIVDVFDYLQFRATNKLFHLAAPPLEWRSSSSSMSRSRFDDLSLSPLFGFSENKDKRFTIVHPKHGLKYKYNIKMTDWEICCSKDGWLLLVAGTKRRGFFFNPFTKQVVLPALRFSIRNTRCVGLSHRPTSSECVIVDLDKPVFSSRLVAYTYIPSERVWGWDKVSFEKIEFPLYNISPALHNGLFYYLSIKGKLAVIEAPRGEIAKWKELVEPQAPCTGFFNSFLVECNGNLLSVFECSSRKWVQVFKLNESTMRWIKVESLNNHMLFVGNNTSLSTVAKIPGMENKIYFPRFYNQSIVFYCLETNKYHTFENEVVNFHHVKEHLNSCWIEPRWH